MRAKRTIIVRCLLRRTFDENSEGSLSENMIASVPIGEPHAAVALGTIDVAFAPNALVAAAALLTGGVRGAACFLHRFYVNGLLHARGFRWTTIAPVTRVIAGGLPC